MSGPIAGYQYDGRNFRILRTLFHPDADEVRHYYYNGQWQVLEERVGLLRPQPEPPAPVIQDVWGLRYIDDLVLRDRDASGSGVLGERVYALQDPNWNVTALADTSGAPVARYGYQAYGLPTPLTAAYDGLGVDPYGMETLYCGYNWDAVPWLYFVRNRVLWPKLGRWNRRDPIGYEGGDASLYRYAGGSPVNRTDESGMQPAPSGTPPWQPPAMGVCWVRVCATQVGPGGVGMHTFLLVPNGIGGYQGFRGGPSRGNNTPGCKLQNQLLVVDAPYGANFPDVPKPGDKFPTGCVQASFIGAGGCDGLRACFSEMTKRVNNCCICYKAQPGPLASGDKGCNCNCATTWLLAGCGVRLPTVAQLPNLGGLGGVPWGWGKERPACLNKPS